MAIFGIYVYLITLFIRPQDWVPFFLNMPVNDFILPLTLIVGIIENRRKDNLPQYTLLGLFVVVVFLSNAVNGRLDLGIEQFVIYFKRAMAFFMIIFALNTTRKVEHVFQFNIFLIGLLAIQGIEQYQTGIGWAGQPPLTKSYDQPRITWIGDWDGPNVLGLVFVIGIGFSFGFIFGSYSPIRRLTNIGLCVLIFYGLFLTNSRGAWLSALLIPPVYFYSKLKPVKAIMILVLIFGAGLAYGPARTGQISTKEASAHDRTWAWEQGLQFLRENPVLGIGKGQFAAQSNPPLRAHNNYVEVSAETGLVGFFLWICLSYFSLKGLFLMERRALTTPQDISVISAARTMLTSMVGFCAVTFFVSMELDIIFVMWALCGSIILLGKEKILNFKLEFEKWDFALVGSVIFGILGLIYYVAILEPF